MTRAFVPTLAQFKHTVSITRISVVLNLDAFRQGGMYEVCNPNPAIVLYLEDISKPLAVCRKERPVGKGRGQTIAELLKSPIWMRLAVSKTAKISLP